MNRSRSLSRMLTKSSRDIVSDEWFTIGWSAKLGTLFSVAVTKTDSPADILSN